MTRRRSVGGAAAAAVIVMLLTAAPASARQDAGVPTVTSTEKSVSDCSLERLGTQFVRCDDLTGNGVTAPGWVHSRG